jgi:hypothetical protein
MRKGAPTPLTVPLNIPVPTFCTVILFVALVPFKIVPYAMFPGVTRKIGAGTGALVALPVTVTFVSPPPENVTLRL